MIKTLHFIQKTLRVLSSFQSLDKIRVILVDPKRAVQNGQCLKDKLMDKHYEYSNVSFLICGIL